MPSKYDAVVERIKWTSRPQRSMLAEEQLIEFESWLGYALPADYREFLRHHGGVGVKALYALKDARKKRASLDMFFDVLPIGTLEEIRSRRNTFELEDAPGLPPLWWTVD